MTFRTFEHSCQILVTDEAHVAEANALEYAMMARLAWMRVRQLIEKRGETQGQPMVENNPSNRDQTWAEKLLKGRKVWY